MTVSQLNFVAVTEKEVLPGISLVVSWEVATSAPLPGPCHCLHSRRHGCTYLFSPSAKLPKDRLEYLVFHLSSLVHPSIVLGTTTYSFSHLKNSLLSASQTRPYQQNSNRSTSLSLINKTTEEPAFATRFTCCFFITLQDRKGRSIPYSQSRCSSFALLVRLRAHCTSR
ncbi:hypothetical protein HZ326_4382 [Fusarium oxysporum f. sp. albedinis]|nr:hypothetical protein HZ326_4382 [Fusarium oxysporum f. sp. albedinis]